MPSHATLSASAVTPRTLAETGLAQSAGTYPGADDFPGATTYPGRGSDISASGITTTGDYIPATVPFTVQTGSRIIYAQPIT